MPAIMTPEQFELCLIRHARAGAGVAAAWDVLCVGVSQAKAAKTHNITPSRVWAACAAIKKRHMKLLAAYGQSQKRA